MAIPGEPTLPPGLLHARVRAQGVGRLALQLPPPDPRHHAARCRTWTTCTSSRRRSRRPVTTIAELLQFTPSTPRRRAVVGAGRRAADQPDRPDVAQRRHRRRAGGDARARRLRDRRRGPRDRLRRTRRLQPGAAFGGADQGGHAGAAAGGADDARRHPRGRLGRQAGPGRGLPDRSRRQRRPRAPHHRPGHADDRRRAARRPVAAGRGRQPGQGDRRERDRRGRVRQHLHPARRHVLPALGERHRRRRQPAVVDGAAHADAGRRPRRRHGRHPGLGRPAAAPRVASRPPTCARPRTPPRRPARPRASSWPT